MDLRVGFLGAGLIATYHSKSLRRSGADVARAGVFDPDPERAAAFAAVSGHTVARSPEEVIEGCDAVYVCTWTSEHPRLVKMAAEAGRAVFCEKPLGVDAATAAEMNDVVERAGVVNQVGLILRRSPVFHMLRSLVHDPRSGGPLAVVFRDDQYLPTRGAYGSTWRGDSDRAGSGVLLEHSIHDVDLLEWIFGPVRRVSASMAENHAIDGIEDVAVVTLEFADGTRGSLISVWHDLLSRPSNRQVEVFCRTSRAQLTGEWLGEVEWEFADSAGRTDHTAAEEMLAGTWRGPGGPGENPDGAFVAAVRAGGPAYPDFGVALRAHRVVEACYRSAATGGESVEVAP